MRTRRPGKKGFTILEVAVVAAIAGILFLLLLRWVSSLVATSASSLDITATQRDIAFATDQFQTDTEAAQGCDPYGLDGPLRDIERKSIQLWVDTNDDGAPDVVGWRLEGGVLQRSVVLGDGTCTFPTTSPTWRTLVEGVDDAPGTTVFIGHQGGATKDADADYPTPDCTGMNAEKCLFDSVEFQFTIRSAGEDRTPFRTGELYPLNLASSRLAP